MVVSQLLHNVTYSFFFPLKQELSVPLLLAFTGTIASELLFPLSPDSFPLSFTIFPCSQTTFCMFDLVELDTNHPLAYSSNISLPLNLHVVGLNQIIYGSMKLLIMFQFFV